MLVDFIFSGTLVLVFFFLYEYRMHGQWSLVTCALHNWLRIPCLLISSLEVHWYLGCFYCLHEYWLHGHLYYAQSARHCMLVASRFRGTWVHGLIFLSWIWVAWSLHGHHCHCMLVASSFRGFLAVGAIWSPLSLNMTCQSPSKVHYFNIIHINIMHTDILQNDIVHIDNIMQYNVRY